MFMNIYDFGDQLIQTGDHDPVYPMLTQADLEAEQLDRFLLAYLCFYHVGLASWLSEQGGSYWDWMHIAAENVTPAPIGGRWPRSSERRHFRGAKCVDAIAYFRRQPASAWIHRLASSTTLKGVMDTAAQWPLFGPWAGFKAADLLEVVKGANISFNDNIALIYKEPRACLDLLAGETGQTPQQVLAAVKAHVSKYREPASGRRMCGIQEAETVLCKYKSHLNGHYPIGKDTKEIRHALQGWGVTAAHLLQHVPSGVQTAAAAE
jgi:Alpha-glutamyl/putrescinyl thymine pyrophosphorylase clade 2